MAKRMIENTRYLAFIGIAAMLVASLAAFGWGVTKTYNSIYYIISSAGQDPEIAVSLIEIVDSFLIAVALYVFAVSMYALFIDKIDLPGWMLAQNLYELKGKLSSVVILVMAVKFVEYLAVSKDHTGILFRGLAVAVVSAALIAFGYFGKKD